MNLGLPKNVSCCFERNIIWKVRGLIDIYSVTSSQTIQNSFEWRILGAEHVFTFSHFLSFWYNVPYSSMILDVTVYLCILLSGVKFWDSWCSLVQRYNFEVLFSFCWPLKFIFLNLHFIEEAYKNTYINKKNWQNQL